MRSTAKSSTKVLDLSHGGDEEGVGVLDNLLEALHSGSALQTQRYMTSFPFIYSV